jgi:hypothetical protein
MTEPKTKQTELNLRHLTNPPFVEFVRINIREQMDFVAKTWLRDKQATHLDFVRRFGISLSDFLGHYIEIGSTHAVVGPVVGGIIKPILAVRHNDDRTGFVPARKKVNGLYHKDLGRAWIETEIWNEVLLEEQSG